MLKFILRMLSNNMKYKLHKNKNCFDEIALNRDCTISFLIQWMDLDKVNFQVKTGNNSICCIVTVLHKSDILSLSLFNNIRHSQAINTPSVSKLILDLV